MKYQGKVIKYADNIDTDVIIPARYLSTSQPEELAVHCMEDLDKDFPEKIKSAKIIVAGKNFGCGSSREHAPIAIKAAGISCVIAADFARIFYRNALNIGLPIAECREASLDIADGEEIEIDFAQGIIKNISKNCQYEIKPFPAFMEELIAQGGLLAYTKQKLAEK